MAKKKLAVAVIHGIGNQGEQRPPSSDVATFSRELRDRIRRVIGKGRFDKDVAWREIFWADVLVPRQMRYMEALGSKVNFRRVREFILCNVADAASYQKFPERPDTAYAIIHDRVREVVGDLEQDVTPGTPLVILAHSFGGHIMSNFIWDLQADSSNGPSPFQRMETVAGFVTFGTNLPLFLFGMPPEDIKPIHFPGTALANDHRAMPWWLNFYDRDDAIAFPLREIGPAYTEMVDGGQIDDIQINVGGLFTSWNPASHNRYWNDRDFYQPTAKFLEQFL